VGTDSGASCISMSFDSASTAAPSVAGSGLDCSPPTTVGTGGGGILVRTGLGVPSIFVANTGAAFDGEGDGFPPSKLSTLVLRSFRLRDSCCTRRSRQLTWLPVVRRRGGDGLAMVASLSVCVGMETISGFGLATLVPLVGRGVEPFVRGRLKASVVAVGDVFSGKPSCLEDEGTGVFNADPAPALCLLPFRPPCPSISIFSNNFSCCINFLLSRSDIPTPNPTAASTIGVMSLLLG